MFFENGGPHNVGPYGDVRAVKPAITEQEAGDDSAEANEEANKKMLSNSDVAKGLAKFLSLWLLMLTYDAMGGDGEGEDDSFGPHYDTPPVSYKKLLPPGVLHPGMPDVRAVKPAITEQEAGDDSAEANEEANKKNKEISDEEKKMIMLSDDFQRFFNKTSRYMERALAEDVDILMDYTGIMERDGEADDHSGMQLSLNRNFNDDRWCRGRVITAMDWSAQFPELLVASYSSRGPGVDIAGGSGPGGNDPDGVVLVWNTRYKRTTPEYVFHCQSPVMSVAFAKFHPNLIIGGTYSGRIVLWDNRVNKRTPVQRSTLSAAAHTHPVYCLSVVGTQHAHNLVSVSTDGRMCCWGSLDMLAQAPQEIHELHQPQRQGKPVAATALAFPRSSLGVGMVGG
ncbi:unnamed protein product [Notodromas monacha]|uniref:Uncharacterized protein n=1 Tax=Notodromas monacha TaxID=399045 RepID=A0A7R9BTU9_9CRUS|nr:unnamed protein product [Notodromas monacha]CAG0921639.1 unnamed protein product [Notodromas monacha]